MALRGLSRVPRAVLLDALGTLVALEPPAPRLRSELAARFGLSVSLREAEQAIGAEITFYRAHLGQGRDRAGLVELRLRCAHVLSRELERILNRHVPAGPEMVEALLASLRFSAFADARPALAQLRRRGLPIVVVSNWDVSLGDVLGRLGLGEGLDGVITSAAVGVSKPDPDIFRRGLEVAGVGATEAVHVGDSVPEDVGGAWAAGIVPVLISRDRVMERPEGPEVLTINSLQELPALLSVADG